MYNCITWFKEYPDGVTSARPRIRLRFRLKLKRRLVLRLKLR